MTGDALVSIESVPRILRVTGLLILDLLGAVVVPAILEGSVWRLIPVHSVAAVVLKEWFLGVPCAAFVGFMMYRKWGSATARWVWVLPAFWFAFSTIPHAVSRGRHSVLAQDGGFWFNFSGAGCVADVTKCRDFYALAVPFIRALAYSGAALLASRILKPPSSHGQSTVDAKAAGGENGPHE
jgi:hypothetical protein